MASDCKSGDLRVIVGSIPTCSTKFILEFDRSARTLLIVGNVTFDSDLKGPVVFQYD